MKGLNAKYNVILLSQIDFAYKTKLLKNQNNQGL